MQSWAVQAGNSKRDKTVNSKFLLAWIGTLALACVVLSPWPAPAQSDQRVAVDEAMTQQKSLFVQKLVSQSVTAQTIEYSGDAAAINKLKEARGLVAQADRDQKAGGYVDANTKLDQAIALVTVEAQRLSQTKLKAERQREAYEKRLHTVQAFLKAYQRVASEKEINVVAQGQLAEIQKLMTSAQNRATEGDHADAIAFLDQAYRTARGDIREMREGDTLTRSLNFKSAAEEYEYENNRNESHIVLLKFAIAERNPPPTRIPHIEVLRDDALALREKANREAGAGKHSVAIGLLGESTAKLLKAIRMSGLYIPG